MAANVMYYAYGSRIRYKLNLHHYFKLPTADRKPASGFVKLTIMKNMFGQKAKLWTLLRGSVKKAPYSAGLEQCNVVVIIKYEIKNMKTLEDTIS